MESRQYITFKQNRKTPIHKIKDQAKFLVSKQKEGLTDTRLLTHKSTITILKTQVNSSNIVRSKKYKRVKQREDSHIFDTISRLERNYRDLLKTIPNKSDLYHQFTIPKRTGGSRIIDAPNDSLKQIQRTMVTILQRDYELLPHHNAHAYTKARSIKTNSETHRYSNHFINVDLESFFPSITEDVLRQVLPQIDVFKLKTYQKFIDFLIELSTLNGSLPQGSPLSPFLSNLIMIPFDYHLSKILETDYPKVVTTRYADDITFSSFYKFARSKEGAKQLVYKIIEDAMFEAYGDRKFFNIKYEKSRVSTKFGKNRITGIKVNKDNVISIGYKEKRAIKQDLASLIIDRKNGNNLGKPVDEIIGMYSFLHSIEPEYAEYILKSLQRKFKITEPILKYITG